MRFVRILLAAAVLLLAFACAPSPANSAGVFVQVSPTTVTAGNRTQIRASCGENVNSATVTSSAFGSVTLQPVAGVLSAEVTVPPTTPKGTYDVRLTCPTGSHASTTLTVLNATVQGQAPPAVRGPGTGGGFLANGEKPRDRTPYVWLGLGLGCLVAAGALALRTRRHLLVRLLPVRLRRHPVPPARPNGERSMSGRR